MSFETVCPHCQARYLLDDMFLGKKGRCQSCRQLFHLNKADTDPELLSLMASPNTTEDKKRNTPVSVGKHPEKVSVFNAESSPSTEVDELIRPIVESVAGPYSRRSDIPSSNAVSDSSGGGGGVQPIHDEVSGDKPLLHAATMPVSDKKSVKTDKKPANDIKQSLPDSQPLPDSQKGVDNGSRLPGHDNQAVCGSGLIIEKEKKGSADGSLSGKNESADSSVDLTEVPVTRILNGEVIAGNITEEKIWQVGDLLLGGIYEVVPLDDHKLYAEGGSGMVHRVRHKEWGIDLAVKSPKISAIRTEEGKLNFERECQNWIDLGLHPNIVTCYMVRRIDGIPRLFAELVSDGSIHDWISNGRLYEGGPKESLRKILDIAIQFAWGLEHAHQQGLIHLDIKPGNVMFSGTTVKVTDFGLSRGGASGSLGDSSGFPGCEGLTPSYCSPEQYEAFQYYQRMKLAAYERQTKGTTGKDDEFQEEPPAPITFKTDIWSWAISVLAMFHGRSPCKHGGQTAAEVLEVFLKVKPKENGPKPGIPPGVVQILRHCFQKDPKDRPQSMQEIADQLVAIYETEIGRPYSRKQPMNTAFTAESFSNRAVSLLDLGKPEEAVHLLDKASALVQWYPQIQFNRSMLLWRLGRISDLEVSRCMEEITIHRRRNPDAFYAYGLMNRERGNLKAAIESFQYALDLDANRLDFQKAFHSTQKLVDRMVQCLERFVIHCEQKNDLISVYHNSDGNYGLIQISDSQWVIVDTASGKTMLTFNQVASRTENSSVSVSAPVARSTDYRWEIYQGERDSLVIQDTQNQKSKGEIFTKVSWGQIGDVIDSNGCVRLSWNNEEIRLYDPDTHQMIRTLPHQEELTAMAMTPDGKWAVSASLENDLKVWDMKNGRCVRSITGLFNSVDALWIDPAHRFVWVIIQKTTLQLWSIDLICNHRSKIRAPYLLCFINSSEEIVQRQSELETQIETARQATAEKNFKVAIQALEEAKKIDGWESVRGTLDFIPILNANTYHSGLGDVVQSLEFLAHDGPISSICLSSDGKNAFSAGQDQIIRMWGADSSSQKAADMSQWRCLKGLEGHYDWIRSIDITSDDHFLVSGSWDQSVRVWNLTTGKQFCKMDESIKGITQVCFAPDNRTVAVASANGNVFLFDGGTGEEIFRWSAHQGYVHSLRFSWDGRYLVTAGSDTFVRVWNGKQLTPIREISCHQSEVNVAEITTDLRYIVSGDQSGKIFITDLTDVSGKTYKVLQGHLAGVSSLRIFPDNRYIVSTSKETTVRFWNLRTGTLCYKLDGCSTCSLAVLDKMGSTMLTASDESVIRHWMLHWEYEFPGPEPFIDDLNRLINVIIGYYQRKLSVIRQRMTPMNYYGQQTHLPPVIVSGENLGANVWARIISDIKNHGFQTIPDSILEECIRNIDKWNDQWIEI